MPPTSQSILRTFILVALSDLGGSGEKPQVLDRIDERFGGLAPEGPDHHDSEDGAGWENLAAWERNSMVRDGLITSYRDRSAVRGVWTLTAQGRAEALRLASIIAA